MKQFPAVMSEETRIKPLWWIGIGVAVAACWCIDLGIFGNGVPDLLDDTWEYAVAAQHLLAGDGFVTRVIHPPLWSLADDAFRVPILVHGPLLPAVFAAGLALFGIGFVDHTAWLSAGFAIVAALLTFRLGARYLGVPAGAAAAMLYTVSPLTIGAVHHDVALTAGAALLAATLVALTTTEKESAPRRPLAFTAGVLLGLGYLVRPEFLLLLPLLLFASGRGAWRGLVGFCVTALPWWVHHAAAVGSPLFNLSAYLVIGYHGVWPDLTVLRDFDLPPAAWPAALREALPGLPGKWAETLPRALKRAALVPSIATGALAMIGGAAALASRHLRGPARWAAAAALIPIAVMTLTVYDTRYLSPFLPLWSLAAAAGAALLAARMPAWVHTPRVWIALLALLALPSTATAWREAHEAAPRARQALLMERTALAQLAPEGPGPLFSDTPDFTAWTSGRPVVWVTRDEFAHLPECGREALPQSAHSRPCRVAGDPGRFTP